MRGPALILLLSCSLVDAAANDHVEVRELSLDAAGLRMLEIETGSGPLRVSGDPGADRIVAPATITVPGRSGEAAQKKIDKEIVFELRQDGETGRLRSYVDNGMFNWGRGIRMELEVAVPTHLDVTIEDGSGAAEIEGIGGVLRIDDGSGSLLVRDAGADVVIDDGSGGLDVRQVAGDVQVTDGSGSIRIENVGGSVRVEDGSGSIEVNDVAADLIVEDSGSGSVNHRGVLGRVAIDK